MVVGFPKRMEETGTQVMHKSRGKEGAFIQAEKERW